MFSATLVAAGAPFRLRFAEDSLRLDPESEGLKAKPAESRIPISLLASRILRHEKRLLSVSRKHLFDQELKVRIPELEARLQTLFQAALPERTTSTLIGEIAIPAKMDFLERLLGSPNLEDRALVEAFFLNPRRKRALQSAHEKTLANMIDQAQESSFFVDKALWSLTELRILSGWLAGSAHEVLDMKDRALVGRGSSLWALRKIVQQSEALRNPELLRLFERALRFASQKQLLHIRRFTFESAAQYDPMTEEVVFSRLSRATLNVWIHEVEHARFQKFSERLQNWLASREYALPFRVDGFDSERAGFFGDLFLILNEINSWRKDLRILGAGATAEQRVLDLYLQAVGPKTREILKNPEWISGISQDDIAKFLRREIRSLNRMSNGEILPAFEKALVDEDLFRSISLRRLAEKRAIVVPDGLERELLRQQAKVTDSMERSQKQGSSPEGKKDLEGFLRSTLEAKHKPTPEALREFDRRLAETLSRAEALGLTNDVLLEIAKRFPWKDLPVTFQQVLKILRDANELSPQHRRVRIFLAFEVEPGSAPFEWSQRLVEALESNLETRRLSDRTLEALFVFYERSLPQIWNQSESWDDLSPEVQRRVRRAALMLRNYENDSSALVALGAQAVFLQNRVYRRALEDIDLVSSRSCQNLLSRSSGF